MTYPTETVLDPNVSDIPEPLPISAVLSVPQFVRSGRTASIVVTYTNPNNFDMVAPVLTVGPIGADFLLSTVDDPNDFAQSVQVLAVAPSGPSGILRPGQSGQVTLTLLSNDTIDNDPIHIDLNQIQAGQTMNWASEKTAEKPSTVPSEAWNVIWANLMGMVGSTTDSYNAALAQAATYLGEIGETTAQVSDVNRLYSFLLAQASATFPTPTLASAVDASLATPGSLSLAIDRTFVSSISGRSTPGIFGLGWTTSWQSSLSADASGNVTIDAGGALADYVAQPNGAYLDTNGEYGTLKQSSGIYSFTAASGTEYVFLPDGALDYEEDTNGNRITLGYNSQNQLAALTYSNASNPSEPTSTLTLTYNAQGFVSEENDNAGDTWSYLYDTTGHLISVTGPGGLATTYTYDEGVNGETVNSLLSVTNPDGSQENFTYDSLGRLATTSQNAGAQRVTYTYDGQSEVTATDAAGHQTTVWYDDLGMASRVANPLGGLSSYVYDNNGNLVIYTDAGGGTYEYSYDQNGNLTQTVNPLGQTVQMTYGSLDNLTSITDANQNTTQYRYDSAGNLLSITYPDSTQQSFTYDPLGNLTETIEQNGDPVGYQTNAQGLVTAESFADGTSETFAYDAHGDLLTAKTYATGGALTGTTTLVYNTANELTSITYPSGQFLDFTYNLQGERTQSVDQDGFTVNYSYDAPGRLSKLTDGSGTLIVQYTYNNLGELAKKLNGNGTSTTLAYDAAGDLLEEVNYAPGGTTVNSSFTYTYNPLGEQTSMTDDAGNTTTYGYDPTGQLTQVNLPGGSTITYVYNAAGDRTEVISGSTTTSYQSNSDNETTQVGATAYTYDANGNLASTTDVTGTTTYSYNDMNQLTSITAPDGKSTTFQYSSLGFMIGENVGGTQTNYLVDPTGLGDDVASYSGSGSLIADYTYGLGLVSQAGPSGTGYYDFDGSGNTVGITGASGTYVNRYTYLPFGDTTVVSAALPNPFTFVGQLGVMQIGSNLFSMRARDYAPEMGQFLSNDALGLRGGDTNIRRYVANRAIADSDPTGLSDEGPKPVEAADAFVASLGAGLEAAANVYMLGAQYGDSLTGVPALTNSAAFSNLAETAGKAGVLIDGVEIGMDLYKKEYLDLLHDSAQTLADLLSAIPQLRFLGTGVKAWDYFTKGLFNSPEFQGFLNKIAPGSFPNVTSQDPNALIGPAGFGTQDFIRPSGNLTYTIDFENDGNVAAQDVTVTQQFDPNLDWSTFQLGSIGFGSIRVSVPPGLTDYQTTVAYRNVDGSSLNVLVAVDFNVQTGLLTVTFTSLDPLTGQAPTGVTDGFLPPDNSTGIGEGYVQYTIQAKSGLATGLAINQQARVVFDINSPIMTNTVTNTIDASPPVSTITALAVTTTSPEFVVAWSGSDGAGPGISSYDVYVSDDGSVYSLWQSATPATSATYSGQAGHTYRFFSVATDDLGLIQPTPTSAQTSITVINPPPPPLVTLVSVVDKTNKKHQVTEIFVTFSGAVNPGEAQSLTTYRLATPGKKGSFTAKNAGIIKLNSATYNAASKTVALIPKKPFALTKPVQLLIDGVAPSGLQDSLGRYIDGDHNGTAGGNAVAVITRSSVTIDAATSAQSTDPPFVMAPALIDAVLEVEMSSIKISRVGSRLHRKSIRV